jgi:ATP-dependent Clp protease protease subunit
MHPTSGGAKGYTEDVSIAYREQERLQNRLFHIIGQHSNHTRDEIEETFRRDKFMNAIEAKNFGLVDEVLGDAAELQLLARLSG